MGKETANPKIVQGKMLMLVFLVQLKSVSPTARSEVCLCCPVAPCRECAAFSMGTPLALQNSSGASGFMTGGINSPGVQGIL